MNTAVLKKHGTYIAMNNKRSPRLQLIEYTLLLLSHTYKEKTYKHIIFYLCQCLCYTKVISEQHSIYTNHCRDSAVRITSFLNFLLPNHRNVLEFLTNLAVIQAMMANNVVDVECSDKYCHIVALTVTAGGSPVPSELTALRSRTLFSISLL